MVEMFQGSGCGGGNFMVQMLCFGVVAMVVERFWCSGFVGGNVLVQCLWWWECFGEVFWCLC